MDSDPDAGKVTPSTVAAPGQVVLEVEEGKAEIAVSSSKHKGGEFTVHTGDVLCLDPTSADYKLKTDSNTVITVKNNF